MFTPSLTNKAQTSAGANGRRLRRYPVVGTFSLN
jgi:hypothetical protein